MIGQVSQKGGMMRIQYLTNYFIPHSESIDIIPEDIGKYVDFQFKADITVSKAPKRPYFKRLHDDLTMVSGRTYNKGPLKIPMKLNIPQEFLEKIPNSMGIEFMKLIRFMGKYPTRNEFVMKVDRESGVFQILTVLDGDVLRQKIHITLSDEALANNHGEEALAIRVLELEKELEKKESRIEELEQMLKLRDHYEAKERVIPHVPKEEREKLNLGVDQEYRTIKCCICSSTQLPLTYVMGTDRKYMCPSCMEKHLTTNKG